MVRIIIVQPHKYCSDRVKFFQVKQKNRQLLLFLNAYRKIVVQSSCWEWDDHLWSPHSLRRESDWPLSDTGIQRHAGKTSLALLTIHFVICRSHYHYKLYREMCNRIDMQTHSITVSATGVLRLLDHVCRTRCWLIYSLEQFKRLLKTHLFGFGVWDRGALWRLGAPSAVYKSYYLLTYTGRLRLGFDLCPFDRRVSACRGPTVYYINVKNYRFITTCKAHNWHI